MVTIPKTLFVRGKGIEQGSEEHVKPTGPSHLHLWRNDMMCVHLDQHEWSTLAHQNMELDCETYQSGTS